jgi:peptide/nickel transport system permease protein
MIRQSIWFRLGRAAKNSSFIIGGLMVAMLVILAAIGPEIAPHNPYIRSRIQWIDGEMERAPIAPGSEYPLGTDPLGRDLLSMLLYGARTTLVIAFIATAVRMLLGLVLGALAGWWPGSFLDRAVTALTEVLAAIPGLILAILLVYAVGIRRGQVAFVVAISVVGWGEVAQIMRSHVLSLRKELFIEAAQAVGLSSIEILSRHVLPNLLATMLSLTALQMGSALLLLGELGFVSVFIGSGTTVAGDVGTPTAVIFETPDWGAMLGSSWRSFRALPWLPAVPAAAFFISILSFNVFGYGLQRFSERGRFYPSGWSVLRFLLVAAAFLFGLQFILARTGPEAAYKEKAAEFDVTRAWADASYLSQTTLEGRYPGSEGSTIAASYIAQQFSEAGLTPFPYGSYFQTYQAIHGRITRNPRLEILGPEGEILYTMTEGVYYDPFDPFDAEGIIEVPLIIQGRSGFYASSFGRLEGINFIVPTPEELEGADYQGILPGAVRIIPDEYLPSHNQAPLFQGPLAFMDPEPVLMIGETAAREILQLAGLDLDELRERFEEHDERFDAETDLTLRIEFGLRYELVNQANVIGYLPGIDTRVMTQRILVAAPYTGTDPFEQTTYPGADENASGVAVMLEIIRLWAEQEYLPKRTVVFAAFGESGGLHYLDHPILPTNVADTWTAVVIYGVGAGNQRVARLEAAGALARPFDQSARLMGVRTEQLNGWRFFFAGGGGRGWDLPVATEYSGIAITRLGDELSGTSQDTLDHLDPLLIEDAGKALAHYLMVLSSR